MIEGIGESSDKHSRCLSPLQFHRYRCITDYPGGDNISLGKDIVMNNNMRRPFKSREVAPAGVYDIDELRTQCRAIGIIPQRSNIRRVRQALDLLKHGSVAFDRSDRTHEFYWVDSQTFPDTVYYVRKNGRLECNCPDASQGNQCKHQIAVLLYNEQFIVNSKSK